MKLDDIRFHQTGWFYLLVLVSIGFGWSLINGLFSEVNQWNRELLYRIIPQASAPSKTVWVDIDRDLLTNPSPESKLIRLLDKYPNSHLAFISKNEMGTAQFLSAYHATKEGTPIPERQILIATQNKMSSGGFTNAVEKLDWLSQNLGRFPHIQTPSADKSPHFDESKVSYAPLILRRSAAPLIWQDDGRLHPSLFASMIKIFDSTKTFQLSNQLNLVLSSEQVNWLLGVTGEVFFGGDSLPLAQLDQLLSTNSVANPKLIVIDDGTYQSSHHTNQVIARLEQQNYLSINWLTWLMGCSLFLLSAGLVVYLSGRSLLVQLINIVVLFSLAIVGQYILFSQLQWLSIIPASVILTLIAIILNAYQSEKRRFIRLQRLNSELLETSVPVFYETRQFEKLKPWLESAKPRTELMDKVFDVALQAETENNKTLALKLFEWMERQPVEHKGAVQKLSEYRIQDEQDDSDDLDKTLVIAPGQSSPGTISNPALQIENFGRYQVEGVLGKGAMGIVFQGVDPKINRHVAIKTLQLSIDEFDDGFKETKERFFREAETAGNLSHANIVTIYDVGEEGELGYIAMDLLTGAPLSNFLKPASLLPAPLIYQLMIQITDALDYAHKQNVVHRDIKPANIIYDDEIQRVTLTDFGIACVTDQSKTRTGTIMGSPFYMSPEQVLGERVDGRSDIFSLGVTFYQLLTGHLPFNGESIASVAFHITKTKHQSVRHWNSKLPASAVRITNKAMHKDAAKRYQTMFEFKQALISALKRDYKKAPIV